LLLAGRPRLLWIKAPPPPSRYLAASRCACLKLTPNTPAADSVVRLPASTSVVSAPENAWENSPFRADPEFMATIRVLGLTERGINIVFVKEDLTGEDSPMSTLLLSVMGAFAQFERELIRERQCEGIAIAKREGKYTGRKPSLSSTRAAELRRRVADGDSKAALAREFGISRDTLYRYVPVKKCRARKFGK
jgi:hypothetical protein